MLFNDTNTSQPGDILKTKEKTFNVKTFPILSDDYGQYTEEPVLLGIANHLYMSGFGGGGMLDAYGGSLTTTGLSEFMLNKICYFETSHNFGYTMTNKDLNGYYGGESGAKGRKTYGYGLLFHPNGNYMQDIKNSWTQTELETIYLSTVKIFTDSVNSWARKNGVYFNQNQVDAVTCACYNFGVNGFFSTSVGRMIKRNANDPNIKNAWSHLSDSQARKHPGLPKRREFEANWYFGQVAN